MQSRWHTAWLVSSPGNTGCHTNFPNSVSPATHTEGPMLGSQALGSVICRPLSSPHPGLGGWHHCQAGMKMLSPLFVMLFPVPTNQPPFRAPLRAGMGGDNDVKDSREETQSPMGILKLSLSKGEQVQGFGGLQENEPRSVGGGRGSYGGVIPS